MTKNVPFDDEDDDFEGRGEDTGTQEGGTGGQSGQIEFRDFLASATTTRDDNLPIDEERRLLSVHKELNEAKVKKQKEIRERYKDLKEGKKNKQGKHLSLQGAGGSAGPENPYKSHPILAEKFRGVDDKESPVPTQNDNPDTNPGQREELELQFRLTHTPEFTSRPRFNPKPSIR